LALELRFIARYVREDVCQQAASAKAADELTITPALHHREMLHAVLANYICGGHAILVSAQRDGMPRHQFRDGRVGLCAARECPHPIRHRDDAFE
jgi:hypothetical protein